MRVETNFSDGSYEIQSPTKRTIDTVHFDLDIFEHRWNKNLVVFMLFSHKSIHWKFNSFTTTQLFLPMAWCPLDFLSGFWGIENNLASANSRISWQIVDNLSHQEGKFLLWHMTAIFLMCHINWYLYVYADTYRHLYVSKRHYIDMLASGVDRWMDRQMDGFINVCLRMDGRVKKSEHGCVCMCACQVLGIKRKLKKDYLVNLKKILSSLLITQFLSKPWCPRCLDAVACMSLCALSFLSQ